MLSDPSTITLEQPVVLQAIIWFGLAGSRSNRRSGSTGRRDIAVAIIMHVPGLSLFGPTRFVLEVMFTDWLSGKSERGGFVVERGADVSLVRQGQLPLIRTELSRVDVLKGVNGSQVSRHTSNQGQLVRAVIRGQLEGHGLLGGLCPSPEGSSCVGSFPGMLQE
jgi:hypothetical protein